MNETRGVEEELERVPATGGAVSAVPSSAPMNREGDPSGLDPGVIQAETMGGGQGVSLSWSRSERHGERGKRLPLLMVLDDDQGLLRLISKLLSREGYRCVTHTNPLVALREMEEEDPTLLLVDHRLGEMTGQEFLDRLEEMKLRVPFIVITGQGDERVAVHMMKQGALDYVVKDAGFLDLLPLVIRRALDHLEAGRRAQDAEAALRRSEANLAKAQQISRLGSYEIAVEDGELDHWSLESYRILGLDPVQGPISREEFIERFVYPDDRDRFAAMMTRAIEEGAAYELEFRIVRTDGTLRYLQSAGEPVRDASGRLVRVIGTTLDITERKRLQQEVLEISEQERRRIGHDLHDGICQHLAGIELMCRALEQEISKRSRNSARQASNIASHVRQAIQHARGLARGLSPVAIEENGLMVALQDFAENIRVMFRVDCVFLCDAMVPVRENTVAAHLFRIAQEAVSNAIKHGRARRIEIQLARLPQRILLGIHDNGIGIAASPPKGPGMGLRIMQYRADMINGSLVVQHNPDGGTTVVCTVRVPEESTTNSGEVS